MYILRWCLQSFHYFLQVFPCLSPQYSLYLYRINLRNKPKNIQIWPSENNNTDLVANMARREEKVAASSFKALSSFRSFIMVSVTMDFSASYLLFRLARAPSAVWVNTCRDHDLLFYVHFQANESCSVHICWNEKKCTKLTCLLALSTSLRVAICSLLVLSRDLSFRISSMQLSLSLSRRGASSLAAALCLDSCRDLSTARWRCFTWGKR